jgi:hypothetical protein
MGTGMTVTPASQTLSSMVSWQGSDFKYTVDKPLKLWETKISAIDFSKMWNQQASSNQSSRKTLSSLVKSKKSTL